MTTFPQAWPDTSSAARRPQSTLSAVSSRHEASAFTGLSPRTGEYDPVAAAALVRDFAYAAALVDGAERMRCEPDLPSLLSTVAADAATLIDADGVAVIRYSGIRRVVSGVHVASHIDDPAFLEAVGAAGEERWLVAPESTGDLNDDVRWIGRGGPLAAVCWRSVMTVSLFSWNPQDQTRLLWFSDTPLAFSDQTTVAGLFGRLASLAIHDLRDRRESQRTNVKLPSSPTASSRARP